MGRHKILNTPAVRRMPSYLHCLAGMVESGLEFASTSALAAYISVDPIVVRKDVELTGLKGCPGVGYRTKDLMEAIRCYLGWNRSRSAILVGAGSLGGALLGHRDFAEAGLCFTGVFDSDGGKIGREVAGGLRVEDVAELSRRVGELRPQIAVICVPVGVAQKVVDELVGCGVKAFWNFANVCLNVPPDVVVQREVIAGGLAMLSMKLKTHAAC